MFTMPDEKFAACAGFDALAYVRALKLMLLMSIYITVTVFILVLPVNVTGHFVELQLARQTGPAYANCTTEADASAVENAGGVRSAQSARNDCPSASGPYSA